MEKIIRMTKILIAIKEISGIQYYNSGDWVESCTALVEDDKGIVQIINMWTEAS